MPWSESDASSASFLAIVPPIAHVGAIESVQRKFPIQTDVSPHITVKAQPGLQRPELWREPLAVALRTVMPFQLQLGPVGWFGREILYLSVVGEMVVDLHWRILDCLEQAGVDERFEYDGEEFVPHLTVAAPWVTAGDSALDELQAAIELLELRPFAVTEITEFHRSAVGEPYRPVGAFKLLETP
ncbi:MAG: 2'-5' RNA ligase family protein [Actinomycetota bacterium]|nr:2'-5' RNA ligase family protein [Actinomycetota bacterium]